MGQCDEGYEGCMIRIKVNKLFNKKNFKNVIYMKNKENLNISSTVIRNKLQKNECIDDLVARDVKDYILRNKLYF